MSEACPRCGLTDPTGRLGLCPRCLLDAEIPPARLGGSIELLEEVGHGGMGTVYKARHLRLERTVAVKFLPESLASDAEARQRFEREARALARLSHPNVVAIHDFGQEQERSYIVMEYVDGRPLSERLPMDPKQAVDVGLQVAEALAYAHRQGVVHRDVKPQNILLDGDGRAKVSDFGIARLLGPEGAPEAGLTGPQRVVGTPAYMAPEALAGSSPDPRMDVFSLGVVLHEMATGRRPSGEIRSLPLGLDRVVRRAVALDPAHRYATVREMIFDLEALRADGVSRLPPEERNWLHAVALLMVLATSVGLWSLLRSITPRVLDPQELQPLIMLGAERMADGRVVTRARFETWPTLTTIGFGVLALAAFGALRRHWREAGLDQPTPDVPISEARWVVACGVVSLSVYLIRQVVESMGYAGAMTYVPILGGVLEIAALFFLWVSILQAWRTSRPLSRERLLGVGFGLALVPPVVDLSLYLLRWRP